LALLAVLAAVPAAARWDGPNPYAPREDGSQSLYAIRLPNIFYHNVGLLEIMVTNVGVVGNPGFVDSYGAGWRGGEYLYAASLWIGAIAPDNLAYVSTGAYEFELRPPLDPVYTIYESFEGSTGGERAGFSAIGGDDDGDGLVDEDFQNGRDDDGDGKIDEDYRAISQQMFSCEYWDNTEEASAQYPEHRPLNLHFTQQSFGWSNEGANEFVGIEYKITNEGFEVLRDLYLGYFVDSDAGRKEASGYWTDDGGNLATVDTTYVDRTINYSCTDRKTQATRQCGEQELHIDIAYMYDTPGSSPGGNADDDMAPGSEGCFGGMFLGHTTDATEAGRAPKEVAIYTCRFFSGAGSYPDGDPRNDYQRYDLLSMGTKPRRPTGTPADYRYAFSAGPFKELLPGEQLEFQVAFVIGDQYRGMLHNAITAQRIYNGQWRDVDNNPDTGCNGRETCLRTVDPAEPTFWKDPCDSLAPQVGPLKNTTCDRPDYWVDNDCNCCTPLQDSLTACPGKETLIHWVGTVAPPPPKLNSESQEEEVRARLEGDRRVRIEWDNTSELVVDPIQQKILFTGYRVWRVEGWTRPIGSTGPSPEDWRLVADLNYDPMGSQLDLTEFTNPFAVVLDTLPNPVEGGEPLLKYEVGRYFYEDTVGLKNGMIYFYDVTAYSSWIDNEGQRQELSSQPAAVEREGIRPAWGNSPVGGWKDQVMVVPNPWNGRADWDLTPSDSDPTGTHLDFARLPPRDCKVRIYTLSGDLVEELNSAGKGTVRWRLLSRRGQDITSGVYLYTVTCEGDTKVGRFTVIR